MSFYNKLPDKSKNPSKDWKVKLLTKFCSYNIREEILGDLQERYLLKSEKLGDAAARKYYWREVLSYARPSFFKNPKVNNNKTNTFEMIRNYFKIAYRTTILNKAFSSINVIGLSLGMTCFLLVFLWIQDELSYDRYHQNADNIYRVVSSFKNADNPWTSWPVAHFPFATEAKNKYPEVKNVARFLGAGRTVFRHEENYYYEDEFYRADSTVFNMFSWNFISGNPRTALDNPNSMVVTRSIAEKYFGTTDCLGKSLVNDNNDQYNITGVIENIPRNSHFRFDALFSSNNVPEFLRNWRNLGVLTYIELPDDYNYQEFQPALDAIITQHITPIHQEQSTSFRYELQPITSIHLHSKVQFQADEAGDINTVYIFSVVAILMLIIACINYMNLATARFLKRAREVGVRKVAGSSKLQLVMQFLSESLLITLTAAFLCVFLIYIFLPLFNEIAQKQIPFSILFQTNLILLFPGVVLFTGILGGSYPAFYLSSFKPINVLKGRMASKRGKPMLRKALVVTQFIISLALLTSTLIAYRQLEFLSNKNLGFDREHVVLVNMRDPGLREKFQPLKNELLTIPEVVYVSTASNAPGNNMPRMRLGVETNDGNIEEDKTVEFYFADFDFIQTLGMEIIEGRNLDEQFSSDTAFSVLVNEAMVSQMNWDHPLGKKVKLPVFGQDSTVTKEVVGVIKDFHQKSLYDHIEPLLVQYANSSFVLYVKIDGNDISNTLQKLENSWRSIHPDRPFDFSFLDQDFAANYDEDKRRGKIFAVFSVLSIVIACLGLLGLVAFTTEERNKDIAIRKINGASTPNLVILLSKDFLMLVLLGAIIALPVTWYYMDNWLNNFAYKIILLNELGLALKATILLIIATMLTVGYHTIRTATKNPVRYLRSD